MAPSESLAVVEPMRLADVPTVAAIERWVFASPWSPNAFAYDLTRRRDACYLVARYLPWVQPGPVGAADRNCDPSIMGYAGGWFIIDEAHIATIAVRPEWRGRGVGELLFSGLLRWAMTQGASYALLEVRVSNIAAQHLYAKYGLEVVGRRRRYYTDNHEDALLMTVAELNSPAYAERLAVREAALAARLRETLSMPPVLQPLAPVPVAY